MRIKWNAPVTLSFALASTIIFVLDKFLMGSLMGLFTVYPQIQWSNPFSILTLLTHCLGHGSMDHLLSNLTFILLIGPIVEEKYGSSALLYMIIITALITGIITVLFMNVGLMGASGIVFMLILLVSFTNVNGREIPITFILIAILFLGKEVLKSFELNNISETAHVIGGICGSAFGFKNIR